MTSTNHKDKPSALKDHKPKGRKSKRKIVTMRGLCHKCWSSGVDISKDDNTGFTICSTCKNAGKNQENKK